ncbi:hypothetical protein ACF0H5_018388 [Mactra antiquata]
MKCKAYTDKFVLNAWYANSSEITLHDSDHIIIPNITSFKVWKPFHDSMVNLSKIDIPKQLDKIKSIPMSNLLGQLEAMGKQDLISVDDVDLSKWTIIGIILLLAVGFSAVLFIFIKFKFCKNRRQGGKRLKAATDDYQNEKPIDLPAYKNIPNVIHYTTSANQPASAPLLLADGNNVNTPNIATTSFISKLYPATTN